MKSSWMLAWPMILSNITVPLLGLVDTAVIGHLEQPWYLGAVAIGSNIFMFLYFSFNFLRMGTTGLAAQQFGSRNYTQLHALIHQSCGLAIAIGLVLVAFQGFIIPFGIGLIGGSEQVQHFAQVYCATRIWSAPAALMNFAIIGWLIGLHDTKSPLKILVATNVVNILLDIIFVVYLNMDVKGVAFATVLADFAGAALGVFFIRKHLCHLDIAFNLRSVFNIQQIIRIIAVNRDLFIRTLLLLSTFVFFTAQGAAQGDEILAANAVLISFLLLISNALDGFANAAEALTGHAIGQKDSDRLHHAVFATGLWTVFIALFLSLFFLIAGKMFIHGLTDIEPVRRIATLYLPWLIILPLTGSWCFWLDGVFVGTTQSQAMRNTMLLSVLFVFLPTWYLTTGWGNHGLWFALNCWMLARGLGLGFIYWRNSLKQRWFSSAP